jgi:hypothetical protein
MAAYPDSTRNVVEVFLHFNLIKYLNIELFFVIA